MQAAEVGGSAFTGEGHHVELEALGELSERRFSDWEASSESSCHVTGESGSTTASPRPLGFNSTASSSEAIMEGESGADSPRVYLTLAQSNKRISSSGRIRI